MKRILPYIFIFMLTFAACDDRPKDVLSRGKMEDVLYDYHLMQGLIDQMPSDERMEKGQDYINAVYEKHGITEAQFDSSVVYYNRHTKELYKIYNNLKERYTEANEEIQIINGNNDMMAIFATGGDTTNLWNSSPLMVLRNKELTKSESFTILADTSFRPQDQFIMTFTPFFLKESKDEHDISLYVGLNIIYDDNTHVGTTRSITYSGTQQLMLKGDGLHQIQRVVGFFYYRGKKNTRNLCLLDDISLVRMHKKEAEPIVKDTIKTDTLKKDTTTHTPEHRMSPEEIRLRNKSNEQINIQTAPSVRTPNSIGPRRRKATNQKK